MAVSGWGKYPIPESGEAAGVPADLMQLVEALDAHTVLFATSTANRNALYNGIPAGAVVVSAAAKAVWLSLGGSVWHTIASDSGWLSTGFSFDANFSNAGSRYRVSGSTLHMEFSSVYEGTDIVSPAHGNIPDLLVANFSGPVSIKGASTLIHTGNTFGGGILTSSGGLFLQNLNSGSTLATGQTVRANFSYLVD